MVVKVVTDSTSDISPQVAEELGITVVPVYVRFGEEVYRDGVDISQDEFYRKLAGGTVHPSTAAPSPGEFARVYEEAAQEADEVVSIHVTSKHSATYESALQGRELARVGCRIEVVDSLSLSMGLGLIAMAAARLARAGEGLQGVMEEVGQAVSCIRVLGLLDTLKYLAKGGRIGKSRALLGTLLNVKPLLTIRDGELSPSGLARTRTKGIERLFNFVKNALNIQEVAIVHSTTPDEASLLVERISSIFDKEQIHVARLGPALGVHGGPGTVLVAIREKLSGIRQEAGEGKPLKKRISLPSLHRPKLNFSCPQL